MRKLTATICLTIAVLLGSMGVSRSVYAFCYAPTAPNPPSTFSKPDKPSVPYCINEFTRTHTCDDWEISSYRTEVQNYQDEVQDYVQKLKSYAEEAKSFVNDVIVYANCEIRNLD